MEPLFALPFVHAFACVCGGHGCEPLLELPLSLLPGGLGHSPLSLSFFSSLPASSAYNGVSFIFLCLCTHVLTSSILSSPVHIWHIFAMPAALPFLSLTLSPTDTLLLGTVIVDWCGVSFTTHLPPPAPFLPPFPYPSLPYYLLLLPLIGWVGWTVVSFGHLLLLEFCAFTSLPRLIWKLWVWVSDSRILHFILTHSLDFPSLYSLLG